MHVEHPAPSFTLAFDTIRLDLDKYEMPRGFRLFSACKWRGCIYLLIGNTILCVSESLDEVRAIASPDYDISLEELYVRHDSLLINGSKGDIDYVLYYSLEDDSWVPKVVAPRYADPIRDDDAWRLYFRDFGEFGGRLRFIDKATGQEYLYMINNERFIRYQDDYYLICHERIYRIHDPASYYAELIQKEDEYELLEYPSINSCFASAFCLDGDLYVMANDKEETYIARLNSEELEYVFGLGRIWNFNWIFDHNLQINQSDDKILLLHHTMYCSSQGSLDIDGPHVLSIDGWAGK